MVYLLTFLGGSKQSLSGSGKVSRLEFEAPESRYEKFLPNCFSTRTAFRPNCFSTTAFKKSMLEVSFKNVAAFSSYQK